MNDYISRKDALVALSELLRDIKENPKGNGGNAYADGIWQGERSCAIEAILRIKALPAEDVKPVVRGEWYNGDRNEGAQKVKLLPNGDVTDTAYCSVCGDWLCASDEYAVRGRFCPNCGADMRGENSNDKENL